MDANSRETRGRLHLRLRVEVACRVARFLAGRAGAKASPEMWPRRAYLTSASLAKTFVRAATATTTTATARQQDSNNNNNKQQHFAYSKSPNRTNLLISATFGHWPPKRKLGHGCHKVLTIKMLACRSIPDDGVGVRVAVVGLGHRLECDGNCQGHAQASSYIARVAWALRSSAARGSVASCKCHKAPKQPQTQRQP